MEDYYAAPRTLVEDLPATAGTPERLTGRVVAGPAVDGTRTARIEVAHDGTAARADLGQALRGHRFAHREEAAEGTPPPPAAGAARTADVRAVPDAPGLVWTRDGEVAVDATGQDDLAVLALLGRLYPETVVLRPAGPAAVSSGGPGRLVVHVTDLGAAER
ncbi:hypothetical protein [Streptomyces sp. ADI93-02]|uniref:hypothetical protein n=1 Tax=Streptomyces sp. ADI93-02 TaxID=1522757 RepID=UPI000F5560D7|nr:hypothetical protein EES40_27690 [Streptomyces sp. ADI93-02]